MLGVSCRGSVIRSVHYRIQFLLYTPNLEPMLTLKSDPGINIVFQIIKCTQHEKLYKIFYTFFFALLFINN